jgi:hypothetical protein
MTTGVMVRSGRLTVRARIRSRKYSTGETQLAVWSSQSHNEEPLTVSSTAGKNRPVGPPMAEWLLRLWG